MHFTTLLDIATVVGFVVFFIGWPLLLFFVGSAIYAIFRLIRSVVS